MNATRHVVQIVPRFFPTACGVGDYARLLAAEWQRRPGLVSSFLVADEHWSGSQQPESGGARRMMRSVCEDWTDLVGQPLSGVVLQYSGYGYARRGAPLWLVRTLRSFRRRFPQVPLITMFHEVAAAGPVSTSSFWLRPLQLYVALCLRALSDREMTNCEVNARVLETLPGMKRRKLVVQPVYSNFGEVSSGASWVQRVRRIVVFNSNFGEQAPTARFWLELAAAAGIVTASTVTMIGRPVEVPPGLSFQVVQPGFLAAEEVSAILADSAFGYVFHGPLLLGKSGVFAAFAAHGVVPLIQTNSDVLPDGLIEGKTFHALRHSLPADAAAYFEQIRLNVQAWYLPHSLAATAEVYGGLLDGHRLVGGGV